MKFNKGFSSIAIIVIVFVLLAAGGGVYYWQKLQPRVYEPPASQPPAGQPTLPDETAGWKTYRNEEYGFEVKYPPAGWKVVDANSVQGDFTALRPTVALHKLNSPYSLGITVVPKHIALIEKEQRGGKPLPPGDFGSIRKETGILKSLQKEVVVDGYRLLRVSKRGLDTAFFILGAPTYFEQPEIRDDKIVILGEYKTPPIERGGLSFYFYYFVGHPTDRPGEEVSLAEDAMSAIKEIDSILSTFKFIPTAPSSPQELLVQPPPSDPITGWKTYRNEKYGFEFEYSRGWREGGFDFEGNLSKGRLLELFNYSDPQKYGGASLLPGDNIIRIYIETNPTLSTVSEFSHPVIINSGLTWMTTDYNRTRKSYYLPLPYLATDLNPIIFMSIFGYNEDNFYLLDQILSTFRFIK